jgi:hypothetical protein
LIEEMEKDREAARAKEEAEKAVRENPAFKRLTTFLYLIMRDELPTGTVCKMIIDTHEEAPEFTNPHLEALAKDYAERLLDD